MGKILFGLIAATAAEVAGLAYWLHWLQRDALIASFLALIAGEAVEWSLLAMLIVKTAAVHSQQNWLTNTLTKSALIIFSESLLWVCWIILIGLVGFAMATLFLLVAMHVKHGAAIAVYTGRPMSADFLGPASIAATVLEAGGAAIFYQLYFSGQTAAGIAVLAVCITIEHSLQFRAAGLLNQEGKPRAFS